MSAIDPEVLQCCGAAFTLRCWPADNLTIHRKEEQVKKALAAGQTTPDILGLRSKFPQ